MELFQLDSDDDFEPAFMYAAETRAFEHDFLEKYRNSTRVLTNDFKYQDDTLFRNGFVFKETPSDHMFLPHDYEDEFDLFKQFYEKLIDSAVLNHYIEEMENFFELRGQRNRGCTLVNYNAVHIGTKHPVYEFRQHRSNFKSRKAAQMQSENGNLMKGIYAKEEIAEGEVILREKPLVLCKSPTCVCSGQRYFECSYCTRSEKVFYVCQDCDIAIYCSEECRTLAYREYHAFECTAYKCHFFAKNDPMWIAFRMLTIGSFYKFDSHSDNKYKFICKAPMYKNDAKLLCTLRKATLILLYLIKYTKYFEYITNVQKCIPNTTLYEKYLKVGGLLITHARQAYSSTFYFPDEMISLNNESKGLRFETPALCIGASAVTHSCKPNATMVFTDNFYSIKALRRINVGETISINYVHLDEVFYGHSGKHQCTCEEYLISEDTYTGKIYKCFKCEAPHGQHMEHYPPMWKCLDCSTYQQNPDFDSKLHCLYSMFQHVTVSGKSHYTKKPFISDMYFDLYKQIYAQFYPEYLYVLQKVVAYTIESLNFESACYYSIMLFDKLSLLLNKYSIQKLDALVSVVNSIAKTFFDQNLTSVHLIELGRVALEYLQPICDFYMLMQHYSELIQLLDGIEARFILCEEGNAGINHFGDMSPSMRNALRSKRLQKLITEGDTVPNNWYDQNGD